MTLRVLLTAPALETWSGAELYVRDLALGLLARGHRPVAYAPRLGRLADAMRDATIPVVADLGGLGARPDVIHGQDNHELLTALAMFPTVPAVRVCHGWEDEAPEPFPRVRRYVCVDETVRDRAVGEWGVPESRAVVLLNFVDLRRFAARPPLPRRPGRALVFSNYAAAHVPPIREACQQLGIALDAVGASVQAAVDDPERLLPQYDLVFAKGRCALEAMAVGAAVVLCDARGLGPMVTAGGFDDLRQANFGMRTLGRAVTAGAVAAVVANYDADDAARVAGTVRATAGLDDAVARMLQVYDEVIAEAHADPGDLEADLRAVSRYLRRVTWRLQWVQSPRAVAYQLARRAYFGAQRLPVIGALLPGRARAQRTQRQLRGQ
jgi:hypothetical protein